MSHSRLTVRVAALRTLVTDRWPGSTEARMVTQLSDVMPRVIRQMWLVTPDGYPTSTPGAPDRGGSSSSHDRLGSLVAQREASQGAYTALEGHVGTAAACVAHNDRRGLSEALQRALRATDDWHAPLSPTELASIKSATRCATHVDAADALAEWVHPECDNVAGVGRMGLCEACYRRRYNWLRRQEREAS